MLLQHVTLNRNIYHSARNTNGNAFDEHHHSLHSIQRKRKEVRRTRKCNSWLSKVPTKSDTSLNRSAIHVQTSSIRCRSPMLKMHPNQITLSSNAATNIITDSQLQTESFTQPFIMVHKKRLRPDQFLSTMQNCIQPPYSQNHFYLLDQANMLKFQRNLHLNTEQSMNFKRKYSDDDISRHCSEMEMNQTSPFEQSLPKTADHISINKYHYESKSPSIFKNKLENDQSIDRQNSEQSHVILSRLEKILDLCGELRSIAKDVELHLNEQSISKTTAIEINEKELDSEQTIVDIYKELENQQTSMKNTHEQTAPPPTYQSTNDISSIHSESNKSIQLIQTESFKTKSPNLRISQTKLRKSEDICSCFLKSFLEKENCELTSDEQEYLNELTNAYILGREQILIEQQELRENVQTSINESLPDDSEEQRSLVYDTNNNNQFTTSMNLSSLSFRTNDEKFSSLLPRTITSTSESLVNDQSSLPALSEMISLKHQIFLHEPIAMKTINVLPGIGRKYAEQLEECGFPTVRRLLGFYLMIKDDQHFVIWLNNKVGISFHSAWLCTNALRSWCQVHL
ncbi:hypothetical protein I4U23_008141 [Adineta vaga]|nr:hypothetical protein I4U23_008141 [Adineta vaga]